MTRRPPPAAVPRAPHLAPPKLHERRVAQALRAYASMVTSANKGAVRLI